MNKKMVIYAGILLLGLLTIFSFPDTSIEKFDANTFKQHQKNIEIGQQEKLNAFAPKEALKTIENPDQVYLQAIHYTDKHFEIETATLSKPVILSKQEAKLLSTDLTDPLKFVPTHETLGCATIWAFKVSFTRKKSPRVNILYCPNCGHLGVDSKGGETLSESDALAARFQTYSLVIEELGKKYFPEIMKKAAD